MSNISEQHASDLDLEAKGTSDRSLPPVTEVGVAALILVVIGGIYLSSYFPHSASLLFPTVLTIVSAILVTFNFVALANAKNLAKGQFMKVMKWALLAYVIVAGMLEYVFVYDGTRGAVLVILTSMLVIFALDVPTIIAFTVARYHNSTSEAGTSAAGGDGGLE